MRKLNPGFSKYIGYTTYESRTLPAHWPDALQVMDEIWVPSGFNREIFQHETDGKIPIRTLPHSIQPDLYRNQPRLGQSPETPFTFLSVFEFSYRKGWDTLLRAWAQTFTQHDPVRLHLHTYHPETGFPERQAKSFLRTLNPQHAPIHVSQAFLSDSQMKSLYASAQAFVLPSRGEGWGIPLMEAMATGLPTIGPSSTGCTDFMNPKNSWLIPGKWEIIPPLAMNTWRMDSTLLAGQEWFEPQVDALSQILREVFEGGSAVATRAQQGQIDICNQFSLDNIATLIRKLL
jgi:glycosyltransferase involved in cell wall biosynthesis